MCSTVSQLKEYRPDCTPVFSNLPKYPSLDAVDTEPELVLDRRLVRVTQQFLKCSSNGQDYQLTQRPGKIGKSSRCFFHRFLLGDKQVLLQGHCHDYSIYDFVNRTRDK
jgi:hypothetical protein